MFDGSKIISIFASTKRNMLCFESSGETDGLTEIQEKDFRNQESTLTMMKISEGKQNGEI